MYIPGDSFDAASATDFDPPSITRAAALFLYDATFEIAKDKGKGDSNLQRWSSLIGIVTAVVGNILISFALNIQRYAHIRLDKERNEKGRRRRSGLNGKGGYGTVDGQSNGNANGNDGGEEGDGEMEPLRNSFRSSDTTMSERERVQRSSYLRSPYWWAGIVLMTVGEAGNFLAYGFAPASIVSPLGVVALISNCVIAPIMLKEHFRKRDFWGVVVAVGGAVTVVLSAKSNERKLGPHEVWGAITTKEFEAYMGITIGLIIALMWISPKYGNKTILIDLGLVGLFGGYTALSTKGVASMLSSTLWRALTTPVTYILVAVLVCTALMQIRYVNKALQRFDSTQVIPVQFVLFTLSVIMGSAILYRDFESATAESTTKFVGGCLLTFFGVWLITSGRPTSGDSDSETESDSSGEERIGLTDQEQAGGEEQYDDDDGTSTQRAHSIHAEEQSLDGAIKTPTHSRRASKISFATEPSRPHTPMRLRSNTSTSTTTPSILLSPSITDPSKPFFAENAAIPQNNANTSHPGLPSTNSTPLLPTSPARPHSHRTTSTQNPQTHPHYISSNAPPLPDASANVRPGTASRNSISHLIPGPLISPLSSSLSAVVADNLRRGVDAQTMKRARRELRRSKSGNPRGERPEGERDALMCGLGVENRGDGLGTSPLRHD